MEYNELLESAARITPQWLAGFFDGEGCVSVFKNGDGLPRIGVSVGQSEPTVLSLIAIRFGNICNPSEKYSKKLGKRFFLVSWSGKSALPILEMIKDHVIIKRKQVELGIEMIKLISDAGQVCSVENKEKRYEIMEQMKNLNSRSEERI